MAGILGEPRERRGVSRHPPRTPRRIARQRRHARRGGRQLHRRTRHQVLGASRIVDQETRQMDRRRRARRDHAALRPQCGEYRSEVAGRARRASAQARPAGSALGEKPRPGRSARAWHALRSTRIRQPSGELCILRRHALAWHVHPRGAGRRRFRDAGAIFRSQPPAHRRDRASRAQVAPAGHPGRPGADTRLLRRAHCARHIERRRFREVAQGRRARAAKAALPFTRRSDAAPGGRHHYGQLPAGVAARTEPLGSRVPFRARLAARRRHGDRAARAAQPGAGGTFRVAGARTAQGEDQGHGEVDPAASAAQARVARRVRRRVLRGGPALRHTARGGSRPSHPREVQSGRPGRFVPARLCAGAPADELPRRRRQRAPARHGSQCSGAEKKPWGKNRGNPTDRNLRPRWRALYRLDHGRSARNHGNRTRRPDADEAVTLQVFDSPENAREIHRGGVRRLLAIAFRDRIRDLERTLARDVVLAPLKADVVTAALERTFLSGSLPMTQADFARRVEDGRSRFNLIAQEIARAASGILAERAALEKKLTPALKALPQVGDDIKQQLGRLLAPGWLARTPWERLQHLPRYVKAASLRVDKLRADPARDARLAVELASVEQPYRRELATRLRKGAVTLQIEQFGWLIEELRVSLFAQELRTPVPVSVKRLAKLWQTLRK